MSFESLTADDLARLGVSAGDLPALMQGLSRASAIEDPVGRWACLSREILLPRHPAAVHQAIFRANYRERGPAEGPPPAWVPRPEAELESNLGRLLRSLGFRDQDELHAWSLAERGAFWKLLAEVLSIRFRRQGAEALDLSAGPEAPDWFPGSLLNIAESCFQADPGAVAVVEHGESGDRRSLTYRELDRLSNRVAGGLRALGFSPGDRVGLVLPMTIEAVAALLGIAKAGCVAVGVAESFAAEEIALRMSIAGARLAITQDSFVRRGQEISLYTKLARIADLRAVVLPSSGRPPALRRGDLAWADFLASPDEFDAAPRAPSDATIVLFSSGTTGDPKAIPWTQTTPIKAAADGFLYHDLRSGDVVAWPSSTGWMMGPWLVYATLINRGTMALYDGHPGTEGFCRFVEEAGVTVLGLVPSLVAAWRAGGWPSHRDWSRIKLFSSTGECSNPDDMLDLMARAGYRPVIEYCGGTEIGGGYITSTLLRPNAPSCFNTVAFGLDLVILDEDDRPADRGEGYLVGPSIGLSTSLLNRDHHETYYAGTPTIDGSSPLRRHGDRIERLPGGYYRVLGRVDDTMNLGGIKVSAVEIERVLNQHPDVRECAAVAAGREAGGPDRLVVYVVPEGTPGDPEASRAEFQRLINDRLNPLFRVAEVIHVGALPRTASNKVMRRTLRAPQAENPGGPTCP